MASYYIGQHLLDIQAKRRTKPKPNRWEHAEMYCACHYPLSTSTDHARGPFGDIYNSHPEPRSRMTTDAQCYVCQNASIHRQNTPPIGIPYLSRIIEEPVQAPSTLLDASGYRNNALFKVNTTTHNTTQHMDSESHQHPSPPSALINPTHRCKVLVQQKTTKTKQTHKKDKPYPYCIATQFASRAEYRTSHQLRSFFFFSIS